MKPLSAMVLALLFVVSGNCVAADKATDKKEGPTSHYVKSHDGLNIHYMMMGEGEPIMLIHGYYANANINWFKNGIAPELAKTHKVIAIDLRGHGKSSRPKDKSKYGLNMWKDVITVLDDQKVEAAHFHGYSMGGTILTQVLYYKPEMVLSATYGGSGIREFESEQTKNIPKDVMITKEGKDREEGARRVLLAEFPDYFALNALSKNGPGIGGEYRKIDLTKMDIPFFAINGEFDGPNRKTHRMKRQIKDFRSAVVEKEGHLSVITPGFMPDSYLNESVGFIRSL